MGDDSCFVNHTHREYVVGRNRHYRLAQAEDTVDAVFLAWLMDGPWHNCHVVVHPYNNMVDDYVYGTKAYASPGEDPYTDRTEALWVEFDRVKARYAPQEREREA